MIGTEATPPDDEVEAPAVPVPAPPRPVSLNRQSFEAAQAEAFKERECWLRLAYTSPLTKYAHFVIDELGLKYFVPLDAIATWNKRPALVPSVAFFQSLWDQPPCISDWVDFLHPDSMVPLEIEGVGKRVFFTVRFQDDSTRPKKLVRRMFEIPCNIVEEVLFEIQVNFRSMGYYERCENARQTARLDTTKWKASDCAVDHFNYHEAGWLCFNEKSMVRRSAINAVHKQVEEAAGSEKSSSKSALLDALDSQLAAVDDAYEACAESEVLLPGHVERLTSTIFSNDAPFRYRSADEADEPSDSDSYDEESEEEVDGEPVDVGKELRKAMDFCDAASEVGQESAYKEAVDALMRVHTEHKRMKKRARRR
jgi:hypothetical protein